MYDPDPIRPSYPTEIPDDIQEKVMGVFNRLPLLDQCYIFAKYKYGVDFKVEKKDLFGLNRHKASRISSGFLRAVREA